MFKATVLSLLAASHAEKQKAGHKRLEVVFECDRQAALHAINTPDTSPQTTNAVFGHDWENVVCVQFVILTNEEISTLRRLNPATANLGQFDPGLNEVDENNSKRPRSGSGHSDNPGGVCVSPFRGLWWR